MLSCRPNSAKLFVDDCTNIVLFLILDRVVKNVKHTTRYKNTKLKKKNEYITQICRIWVNVDEYRRRKLVFYIK